MDSAVTQDLYHQPDQRDQTLCCAEWKCEGETMHREQLCRICVWLLSVLGANEAVQHQPADRYDDRVSAMNMMCPA